MPSPLGPTQTLVLRAQRCPLCDMPLSSGDTWPWHYPALPSPGACLMSTQPTDEGRRALGEER